MAKASTKPQTGGARPRAGAAVPRGGARLRPVGRRRQRSSFPRTLASIVFRRETLGVAFLVTAIVAIPWLVPITTSLSEIRDGVVEALGLHVFLLIALLALLGWLIIRGSLFTSLRYYWRVWPPR